MFCFEIVFVFYTTFTSVLPSPHDSRADYHVSLFKCQLLPRVQSSLHMEQRNVFIAFSLLTAYAVVTVEHVLYSTPIMRLKSQPGHKAQYVTKTPSSTMLLNRSEQTTCFSTRLMRCSSMFSSIHTNSPSTTTTNFSFSNLALSHKHQPNSTQKPRCVPTSTGCTLVDAHFQKAWSHAAASLQATPAMLARPTARLTSGVIATTTRMIGIAEGREQTRRGSELGNQEVVVSFVLFGRGLRSFGRYLNCVF